MHINIILVKQNHKLFINKKFNNFCISGNWNKYGVKEDNSITVGKHVLCHHWPNYSKTPLVRSRWANDTLSVEILVLRLMSASQQWRVANDSNHYPTFAQRLVTIWANIFKVVMTKRESTKIKFHCFCSRALLY